MKKISPDKWNRKRAAHLLVRTGFGATPKQIDAAAAKPMEEVIDHILTPVKSLDPPAWVVPGIEEKPNFKVLQRGLNNEEKRAMRKKFQQGYNAQQRELNGWWVNRMITSPCPLQEKMALFWHGHFATSIRKVRIPYMMYLQNQTFREHALGNWKERREHKRIFLSLRSLRSFVAAHPYAS